MSHSTSDNPSDLSPNLNVSFSAEFPVQFAQSGHELEDLDLAGNRLELAIELVGEVLLDLFFQAGDAERLRC